MKHKLLTGSLSFTVGMGFSVLPAVAQQSPASTEVKPNVIIINVDDWAMATLVVTVPPRSRLPI